MESTVPPKQDIDAIFHRLRTVPANKACFDCGAKNPTWASVTYGVFICIDCSAVHRGLGVHLTFVRSTNLDTNWTWLQLRNMQCGGNGNAAAFFRQHNCTTTDAQQKYNSRAAQLYRDKLSKAAQNAMRVHETKLYFDATNPEPEKKAEEVDFFSEHTANDNNDFPDPNHNRPPVKETINPKLATDKLPEPEGAPSVDFLNSSVVEAPRSTIGVRKIMPKKSGLGGKKGFGATKVTTNFADIEHRAELADQLKVEPSAIESSSFSGETEAEAINSARLAYQDLSIKQQREEDKLKATDPAKARQLERLGMGFASAKRSAVSHSVMSDMKTISQENTTKFSSGKSSNFESSSDRDRDRDRDFFDDYSMYSSNGSSSKPSKYRDYGAAIADDFEIVQPIVDSSPAVRSMFAHDEPPTKSRDDQRSTSRSSKPAPKGSYELDDAQKKFGGAKAISSDQFFGNEPQSYESKANLNRFQGSNSISSSDFFGDGTSSGSGGNRRGTSRSMEFNAPDLEDVKESVKQGVSKVAGRISSLASNVMTSIQDKYGY